MRLLFDCTQLVLRITIETAEEKWYNVIPSDGCIPSANKRTD